MSKKKAEPGKQPSPESGAELRRVKKYAKEHSAWREELKRYWPQMDLNQEMYEFYKSEYTETASNVSLNTPFAIIESQIAKENEATVTVTAKAMGHNSMEDFEEWVASTVEGAMNDPEVEKVKGSFRKKRERWSRSLKAVGNAVAEANYCYVTQVRDGKRRVVADNPYLKNRHFKDVIFNPTRQFDSSNAYYVEDWMRLEDMEDQAYSETKGKDGKVSRSGKFRNLDALKKQMEGPETKMSDDTEIRFISGDKRVSRKNERVRVVTRWELKPAGWTRCVYAGDLVMVMPDEVDPLKIGSHNLLIGMRYVVEGRPYAYGEIDPIYKPVRAQDTIVNQKIEIINRYLRGSYVVGGSLDVDTFMLLLDQGGAMSGDVADLGIVPVNQVPQGAFQEVQELQQAIERAARFSPYSSGVPNQQSDNTQGTKGGILALQAASEPNSKSQMDDVEEMLMRPYAYMCLQMVGNYMASDDIRYALLKGENPRWVKAAKGILTGQATISDMVTAEIVTPEQALDYTTTEEPVLDPMTNQPQVDPATGQPAVQRVPIPGADRAYVFDVKWIMGVKLDAQSVAEKMNAAQQEEQLIQFGMAMGARFSPDRTVKYLARKKDADEVSGLLLTPEEQQAMDAQQKPQQKVSESLAYKDAPPDVQRQIEQQAGLQPSQIDPMLSQAIKAGPQKPEPAGQPSYNSAKG